MTFPTGYKVNNWKKVFDKLQPACGLHSRSLVKNGSDTKFVSFTPLPANTTLTEFRAACQKAFDKNSEELRLYGKVKATEFAVVEYDAKCLTTCGIEECQPCPLLHACTADEQCGQGAVCEVSQENKRAKWCVSSATGLTTMIAVVLAVLGAVAMF